MHVPLISTLLWWNPMNGPTSEELHSPDDTPVLGARWIMMTWSEKVPITLLMIFALQLAVVCSQNKLNSAFVPDSMEHPHWIIHIFRLLCSILWSWEYPTKHTEWSSMPNSELCSCASCWILHGNNDQYMKIAREDSSPRRRNRSQNNHRGYVPYFGRQIVALQIVGEKSFIRFPSSGKLV